MSGALRFLSSSIGKKLLMALTGFFLISFLTFHLTMNLFLFAGSNGAFSSYAEFLGTYPVVRPIEWILFGGFILHFLLGGFVWFMNRMARPKAYAVKGSSKTIKIASRLPIYTGSAILAFLVWHIIQFFIASRFSGEPVDMFPLVVAAFGQPVIIGLYEVLFIILGFHLKHGFQALFQSLGLRTPKYRGFIDAVGVLVWLVIPAGFASIPLVMYFGGIK
ncbi:MAG: succinate dehydrogenase cytochrome b subunit [Spirochaetota bacterium]